MSSETPESKTQLIVSVPGVEPKTTEIEPAYHGQVVSVPASEFRGDPRRVSGHPSNPMTGVNISGLFPEDVGGEPKPTGDERPPTPADLITEVPPDIKTPH